MPEKIDRRKLLRRGSLALAGVGAVGALGAGIEGMLGNLTHVNGRWHYKRILPDPIERRITFPDGSSTKMSLSRDDYWNVITRDRGLHSQNHPEKYIGWQEVNNIAGRLWKISNGKTVDYIVNTMNFIATNIPYVEDSGWGYTKYSTETLFEGGDCEDLSTLAASFFAWAGIQTGIVSSPKHAAVAISLDEVNSKGDYPEIVRVSEMLDGKFDTSSRFNSKEIHPYSVVVIPESMTVAEARRIWGRKMLKNRAYYSTHIDQHLIVEGTGKEIVFSHGPKYLTREEERTLTVEEALVLKEKRRREQPEIAEEYYKNRGIPAPRIVEIGPDGEIVRPRQLKYFYLEPTAGGQWHMYDRLPIEMTFFPAPKEKYRKK